jgi:thymidylate synthase (FAD)
MKIVSQSIKLIGLMVPASYGVVTKELILGRDPESLVEKAGRICYKSENRITSDSYKAFVDSICNRMGHESIMEHSHVSFHCVTDRGVSHEIVRHRLCAFSQESTRYVNYGNKQGDHSITVIEPPGLGNLRLQWVAACEQSEKSYMDMIAGGMAPQIARSVLPTCLKTELIWTANFREWSHILSLRLSKKAHPQMRELVKMIWNDLRSVAPVIFDVSKFKILLEDK